MILGFLGSRDVKLVSRGSVEFLLAPVNIQWITGFAVSGKEFLRGFPGANKLSRLAEDDSPAEDRHDDQHTNRDLAFGRCLFKSKLQGTAQHWREEIHNATSVSVRICGTHCDNGSNGMLKPSDGIVTEM